MGIADADAPICLTLTAAGTFNDNGEVSVLKAHVADGGGDTPAFDNTGRLPKLLRAGSNGEGNVSSNPPALASGARNPYAQSRGLNSLAGRLPMTAGNLRATTEAALNRTPLPIAKTQTWSDI